MASNPFQKAVKTKAKIRLAIDGPSGSGKTYTALIAATSLADGGKIAVIDTERGSAALYSDKFNFDTATLDTFSPQSYIDLIRFAEQSGYAVIVIDSLSHAWEGEGGVLDMHDQATKRQKTQNSYTAWSDVTPKHRALIDAMLQSKCHIIATMRSKMEYVQEKNSDGRTVIRKVGMAPIQRQGMEYEFTIVGDMDLDHNFAVSKSRMDKIADAVVCKPGTSFFDSISAWVNSGEDAPNPPEKISRPEAPAVLLYENLEQVSEKAIPSYLAYVEAHGGKAPANVHNLRNWYKSRTESTAVTVDDTTMAQVDADVTVDAEHD